MSTYPAVTLADGSGNALALTGAGAVKVDGSAASTLTTLLTYLSGTQAVSNAGVSFSTAAVTGLAVDITLASFAGGTSPTVTFFIDRLGADSVWYRIWSSSALNSAGATSVQVGPYPAGAGIATAVFTGTARFGWSSTGAPTAITFSASAIGR
ncbi:hypothetical protein [Kitasatospora sp. NPDC056731]|uniref:hypothetical protein n=1 Tax=Kitasatospora sp. NPDC056731 TaxID=3155422 RepID=UPI003431A8CE